MAQCVKCPNGAWVCGDVEDDGKACNPPGGTGKFYGKFTVEGKDFDVFGNFLGKGRNPK